MKTIHPSSRPWLFVFVVILLAVTSAALSPASPLQQGVLLATAHAAPTPTPELPVDEVSTDLIVLLGGIVLLIILLPILLRTWPSRRKSISEEKGPGDE